MSWQKLGFSLAVSRITRFVRFADDEAVEGLRVGRMTGHKRLRRFRREGWGTASRFPWCRISEKGRKVMVEAAFRSRPLRRVSAIGAVIAVAFLLVAASVPAQTIQPPYNASYTFADLGSISGLPTNYGGLTFQLGDPNVILIGGAANTSSGALYSVPVTRDGLNHITALGGATLFGQGAFNDGGVVFGPSNVLFLARYPSNEIGENKLPSTTTDKVVSLGPLGVAVSPGALNFVPAGFPGAGQLKIVSWPGGQWYTAAFSSDGTGTFDITSATLNTTIPGGPEGFIYVPPGSPLFTSFSSLLVSEYSAGSIAAYTIDGNGDPVVASRAVFMSGLTGAEGAAIDPLTGDFLFSTFGGANHVIVVRGFAQPPTETPTVTSTPAGVATNTPTQTPTNTPTQIPTNTPTPFASATVPTLSSPMLALLGLILAIAGVLLMRRS
jgi:hypothetical protein